MKFIDRQFTDDPTYGVLRMTKFLKRKKFFIGRDKVRTTVPPKSWTDGITMSKPSGGTHGTQKTTQVYPRIQGQSRS